MKYADFPLSAPVNITWEITRKCNLRCIHCLSASSGESPGELSFEECKGIVDQLAALQVFEINFGGGEPLLKDFFLPLLRYIHERGIVTCISTNGTVLTEEAVALFANNPLVNVQVSLDGDTPEVNDRIRGKGTYRKIIPGIELLSCKGVSLSVNTVVTSLNYARLDRLKALALACGAGLRVSRFRPAGRARESWETLRLDPPQLRELSGWLARNPSILTGDSFFSISPEGRRQLGLDMCGAGKMTCCIDPAGDIYPCAFLQEPPFRAGSLREKPFKAIWDGAPSLDYFRRLEPASCRACPRFDGCRGGCPAVASFLNKEPGGADPECLMRWGGEISLKKVAPA